MLHLDSFRKEVAGGMYFVHIVFHIWSMGLGIPPQEKLESALSETESHPTNPSPTPPVRRLAKSFSVATSSSTTSSNVHKGTFYESIFAVKVLKSVSACFQ